MKYINKINLNKNIKGVGIEEKNPVFESLKEFKDFNATASKEDIENYAIKIYLNTYTEADKFHYGEQHLLDESAKMARKEFKAQKLQSNQELLNKAKQIKSGFVYLMQERRVTLHDDIEFSIGFFTNAEVAKACLEELQNQGKGKNIFAYNEEGKNINLENEISDEQEIEQ